MELEELIKDREFEEGEKRLSLALEIAEKQWENVRDSLSMAGDIGEFRKEDFMIGIIEEDVIIRKPLLSPTKSVSFYDPTFYPMYLVDNLISLDEKFRRRGFSTHEALFVFIELATIAGERLGLIGSFAMSFGCGYGYVRTEWIAEKGYPVERELFSKMFFRSRKKDYGWDFKWTSAQERLAEIANKFLSWQGDEELFKKEVKSPAIVKPMLV